MSMLDTDCAHSVVTEVRRFAEDVLSPATPPEAHTVYDCAHPLWRAFADGKLANWWVPPGYGGHGVSLVDSVEIAAALGYADPGFAFTAFLPVLAARMVELFATEDVAKRFLAPLVANGEFCATLGSEAAAGSELINTETTFRRCGGDLVLNGGKQFSTNLRSARFGVVLARDADHPLEFAMIVVPADTPGFEIGPRWQLSGLRGTGTYPATLSDCVVPAGNALRGGGLRVLEIGLNATRILMSAIVIGIVRRLRDLSMEYGEGKQVGGQPLTRNAVFAARMGQWEMELETIKSVCRSAAADYDRLYGSDDPSGEFYRQCVLKSALVTKMHAGQTGWRIAATASESFGGLGYTEDHEVQRLLRDVRHVSIVEAGDDVLRDLMYARYVRRPSMRG